MDEKKIIKHPNSTDVSEMDKDIIHFERNGRLSSIYDYYLLIAKLASEEKDLMMLQDNVDGESFYRLIEQQALIGAETIKTIMIEEDMIIYSEDPDCHD